MARTRRHSLKGSIYHIMLRGNNGQKIFSSEQDKCQFCYLMQEGVERYNHQILAFCLMTNHVHLAVKVGDIPLSKIFQNLAFRYTIYYHRIHGTYGHLFQGRYKSILVSGSLYSKKLIRYIHLNPVRAQMVSDPGEYDWSSHNAYISKMNYLWLSEEVGLNFFGDSKNSEIANYNEFINEYVEPEEEIDFKKGFSKGIIGSNASVQEATVKIGGSAANRDCTHEMSMKLLEQVCIKYGMSFESEELCGSNRRASKVRGIMAYLTRYTKGMTTKQLASIFDKSETSIYRAATRTEQKLRQSAEFAEEVAEIKSQLYV